MLKMLQAWLQQYMNQELPQMNKLDLGKAEDLESKMSTFVGSWRKQGISKKKQKIYFCFIDYSKAFDCVDHNKLENS